MKSWKEITLGDDYIVTNAKTLNKDYPFSEIFYLDTGSITKGKVDNYQKIALKDAPSRAKRLLSNNDIIYSSVRPVNRHYGFFSNPIHNLVVSTGFIVITCNEKKLCPLFLYYYLAQEQIVEELHSIAEGSTSAYPSLLPTDIESMVISIPPTMHEQRAIAAVLSNLDDKIDLLHRQNATLEAMAEALFKEYFVENAKEEWKTGCISDEFEFTMGQSPCGDSFNEVGLGVPMFQGNADFGFRFPSTRIYTTEPTRFAQKFDTLISVRAPVGAQNMAQERCCIGRGLAAFRYKNNSSFYSYTYFKLRYLLKEISVYNDEGTVFGSISKNDFNNIEIIIPDYNYVSQFENIILSINNKVVSNCQQINTLEKLRDTLLPKLMSGEVRVVL